MTGRERVVCGKPLWEEVADLTEQGMPGEEVRAKLGLTREKLLRLARQARRTGRSVKLHQISHKTVIHNAMRGKKTGGVGTILRLLPTEIAQWLIAQIPDGGTLEDVVRAIIVDTYAEETGQQ